MSTLQVINAKHPSSASNNIVLDASGNATFAGTAAMGSSFLRNKIINGGFDVWQRGTSFSSVGFGTYGADRWMTGANTTTMTRSTDVPSGFLYSLSVAQSAADFGAVQQRIEAVNCYDLAGREVTVSFWAKSTTGAQSLLVALDYANASDNFSSSTRIQNVQVSASPAGSWTYYTATFNALPAQAANGLQVRLERSNSAASTTLYTGVQLEVGTVATPFERRQYGQELALCQRYAYAWGGAGQYVGTYSSGLYGDANQITMLPLGVNFSGMRSLSATVTTVGTQGTDWAVQSAAGINQTGFTITSSNGMLNAQKAGHGITNSNANLQVLNTNGRIIVSTEL